MEKDKIIYIQNLNTDIDNLYNELLNKKCKFIWDNIYYERRINMDWKLQLGISIVVPIVSSLLTYLAAIKKSKNDVEAVKISAETEIKKIREESDKELKKIQKETDEKIRLKIAENDLTSKTNEEQLKNVATSKFLEEFMKDPKKSAESLKAM